MREDIAHGHRLGDEGDDPHLAGQRARETGAHPGLYFGKRFGAEGSGFMKMYLLVGISLKNPVDHDAMKMHMGIEQGTKTVDEGDGADPGSCSRPRRTGATPCSTALSEEGGVLDGRIALQVTAQAFRYRQYPLPHRQARNDVVGEMVSTMRRVSHAGQTPRPLRE
jgi:hypothetical protein